MLDHYENCKYTYYYDEYGNEAKKTKADLNGNIQATWLYEYDDNQNLTKRSVDTGEGEPFVQLIQAYDDNGRLIEKREITISSEHIYTYQYDEQNRLASISTEGQVIETYVHEADGSYKISARTGTHADAAAICVLLGGGGHNRAAGCTFDGPAEEAKAAILKAVEQAVPRIITG
jgi:nanoRNase/pAp phosphatase (c-di-AMP/oligoRNAs hydrolase)